MIKRIITYVAMALVLAACSDDDFIRPEGIGADGEIDIALCVPELQSVATRDAKSEIGSIRMLVFDNDGTLLQLSDELKDNLKTLDADAGTYRLKATLKTALRSRTDLNFYFIANYATEVMQHFEEGVTLLSDLEDPSHEDFGYRSAGGDVVPMSGAATLTQMKNQTTIPMMRNSAMITVTDKGADNEPGTTSYPFRAYGMAEQASLLAGCKTILGKASVAVISDVLAVADGEDTSVIAEAQVVNPTENDINSQYRPFLIVEAPYAGKNYYYRVDFRRYKENKPTEKTEELDIKPNHWYKFIIEDVKGPGEATIAKAAELPSSLIQVQIIDVTPKSLNMVTDGSRELGVSHEILNENPADDSTEDLFIKMYSLDDTEYPTASIADFKDKIVTLSDDWMEIHSVADVTDVAAEGGALSDGDGRVYKVTIQFKKTTSPGTLEGEISVDWKGLNRIVPVIWSRLFKGSDLCDVQITIKEKTASGYTTKVGPTDYWEFLSKVKGVDAEANLGTARDEGLHFPVMYGNSTTTLWEYEYDITFHAVVEGEYEYKIETDGPATNKIINMKYEATGATATASGGITGKNTGELKVKVTKPTNSWLYTYGEMVFSVKDPVTKKWKDFPLDLYHTGFFHHHTLNNEDKGWYYYEVLEDDDNNRWLDRNLFATRAGACVVESDGSVNGLEEALGEYLQVATYKSTIENKPDMLSGLCPPGFMIPREDIWNSIRNSNKFVKTTSGSMPQAYLTSIVPGKRIYFPRGRYKDSNKAYAGEARAGYYWSSTPSVGFEKDEVGNWLQAFVITGSVTTYVPIDLGKNATTYKGNYLNVRCVNRTGENTDMYRTYFSVAGATHVFLYNESNGQRTAATPWPGKAIGDWATMESGDQLMSFVLDSPTTPAGDWYVIFNYKDKDGKITSFSKLADGGTRETTDVGMRSLTGWKVVGDTDSTLGETSALGGSWTVNRDEPKVSFRPGLQLDEGDVYTYRIYWPYDATSWKGITVFNGDSSISVNLEQYNNFGTDQVNGQNRYFKYSGSIACLEIKRKSEIKTQMTCQKITHNGQYTDSETFTFPEPDGNKVAEYSFDPDFTGATGLPDYTVIYCYNLEGWDSMQMNVLNGNSKIGSTVTGEKKTDYWPQLYRFWFKNNDDITRFQFVSGTENRYGNRSNAAFKDLDGAYYNNGGDNESTNTVGAIRPSDVPAPANGCKRIAVRRISGLTAGEQYYWYYWGDGITSPKTDEIAQDQYKLIRLESKSTLPSNVNMYYYYKDININPSAFLIHVGAFETRNTESKTTTTGHQTNDINMSQYKTGKLVNQWANPTPYALPLGS